MFRNKTIKSDLKCAECQKLVYEVAKMITGRMDSDREIANTEFLNKKMLPLDAKMAEWDFLRRSKKEYKKLYFQIYKISAKHLALDHDYSKADKTIKDIINRAWIYAELDSGAHAGELTQ